MLLFIFILLSSVLIGLISWWYYLFLKHSPSLSKYNGPSPVPIFGNLYRISSTKDIIPVLWDFHQKYGPVMKMWFGYRPRIIISDYRTAELLLDSTSILDKSYDYKYFEPWLGKGLLTSTGDMWRKQRKLLTPTFHFQILEQYMGIFHSHGKILIEKLGEISDMGAVNIHPYNNLCALDIICEAAMGVTINAQQESDTEYVRSVAQMTKITMNRAFSVFKSYESLFRFSKDYRKQKHAVSVLHEQTNFVIQSKECAREHNTTTNYDEDNFGIKKRTAFLDLLLQCRAKNSGQLTIENVREQVDTFMFEGHDTTTSAVDFSLYCLAHNKEVQDKVVEELRRLFKNDKSRAPTYQDLQDMKYLEMVIKESMRLYPPVPIIARELEKDTEFDDIIIPKGTNLTIFTYGLHRQEEMFPDPEKFDPERFTLENSAKRSPYSYVPFSAGVRNCIGQRFALLEVKSSVSKILMNYEILPVPDFKPILAAEGILRSANGIFVRLKKRKF